MRNVRCFAGALAIALSLPAIAFGDGWQIESADTSWNVGKYSSIALDSNDYPHISHYNANNRSLIYTMWDGTSWRVETVDDLHDTGQYTSLALDSNDNPHISYSRFNSGIGKHELKYARWNGSDWQIEYINTPEYGARNTSIALDGNDYPHIAYFRTTYNYEGYIEYAKWDGNSWQIEVIDYLSYYLNETSLALDSDDHPHIAYRALYGLTYARWNGNYWHKETVGEWSGYYTSIALDSNDYPHISHYDGYNHNLKYARWDGSSWHNETVDSVGDVGKYTSIAVDSDDNPHISYYNADTGDLKYAVYDGSNWQIRYVNTSGYAGYTGTSLAMDNSDTPHISFHGSLNNCLMYAWYNIAPTPFNLISPEDGDTVFEPVTLDWGDSDDGGQHTVTYDLWYSTEIDFNPHEEINNLTDSTYTFPVGVLNSLKTYYWFVVANDGYEDTHSRPDAYWSFTGNFYGEGNLPKTFALHPAAPNPSDGSASIGFALPRTCEVTLTLYDIKGRKIATLAEGTHQPGEYSATVSGLSSGVYIYELKADEFNDTKKMVVK